MARSTFGRTSSRARARIAAFTIRRSATPSGRYIGKDPNDAADPPNPIIYDRKAQTLTLNGVTVPVAQCFGSWHPGACQFVFCDGSVRAIPPSVTIDVLTNLGLPRDGNVIKFDF